MKTVKEIITELEDLQRTYNSENANSPDFVPGDEKKNKILIRRLEQMTELTSDRIYELTRQIEREPWQFNLFAELEQLEILLINIQVFISAVTKNFPFVIFKNQLDQLSKSAAFDYCVKLSTFFGDKIYEQKILPLLNMSEAFEEERQMKFLTREAK